MLLVAGSGYALVSWSAGSIERVDAFRGLTDRPAANAAGTTTFLLVGSDGRTGMSKADMRRLHVGTAATAAGRRADTMLLMQVSATHGTVRVVSLPRDSYVTIPAHTGTDGSAVRERRNKLNAAYAFGGPPLTVATIERTTGVHVDHYLEVDFLGFVRLVDAVGGVDVCTPVRLRDRKAGLRLPKGTSHVDGETGLAYVRARSLDARADLGRVERQQRFLAAMAHRAMSSEVLLDPRALVRFLEAAMSAVRADPGLTEEQLVELGTRLRHVGGGDIQFQTVPVANPSYRAPDGAGGGAVGRRGGHRALHLAQGGPRRAARVAPAAGPADGPAGTGARAGLQRGRYARAGHQGQRRARQPGLRRRGAGAELAAQRRHRDDDPLRLPLHREHQDGGRVGAGGAAGVGARARPDPAGGRRLVLDRHPRGARRDAGRVTATGSRGPRTASADPCS